MEMAGFIVETSTRMVGRQECVAFHTQAASPCFFSSNGRGKSGKEGWIGEGVRGGGGGGWEGGRGAGVLTSTRSSSTRPLAKPGAASEAAAAACEASLAAAQDVTGNLYCCGCCQMGPGRGAGALRTPAVLVVVRWREEATLCLDWGSMDLIWKALHCARAASCDWACGLAGCTARAARGAAREAMAAMAWIVDLE